MSGALRELLAVFDIDTGRAADALKNISGGIDRARDTLGGLASAFIGSAMVKGVASFVTGQIDAAKEARLTAAKLGVSVEELQAFEFAAGSAGVSAEGAATGLKFLNKNIGLALENNKEAAEAFTKLDVSIKNSDGSVREIGDVLPEVADAFAKMGSQQERTTAAMKLFGRQGADLLPLLQGGSKNLDQLRERFKELGGGMSEDFIAKAKEAGKAISGARFGFNAWKRTIAVEFFPVVAAFGNKVQSAIAILQKITKETHLARYAAILLGAAAAAAGVKAAIGVAKFLGALPKSGSFWENVLGLGEFVLVIAFVAALALIFEDLFALINGEDSEIGDLITEFLGAEQAAQFADELREAWAEVSGTIRSLIPDVQGLGSDLLKIAVAVLPYVLAAFVDIVRIAETGLSVTVSWVKAIEAIGSAIANLDPSKLSGVTDAFAASGNQISRIWGNGSALAGKIGQPGLAPGAKVPDAFFGGRDGTGGGVNVGQVTNKTDITITGAKDPAATGQAVKKGVADANSTGLLNALGAVGSGG